MTETPLVRIPIEKMRQLFNDGRYWERAANGEFNTVVLETRHPSLLAANEPFCTQSQMVSYRDQNNNEIARLHQYLRPDCNIGASGKPDPKRLFQDGILYRLEKAPKPPKD